MMMMMMAGAGICRCLVLTFPLQSFDDCAGWLSGWLLADLQNDGSPCVVCVSLLCPSPSAWGLWLVAVSWLGYYTVAEKAVFVINGVDQVRRGGPLSKNLAACAVVMYHRPSSWGTLIKLRVQLVSVRATTNSSISISGRFSSSVVVNDVDSFS